MLLHQVLGVHNVKSWDAYIKNWSMFDHNQ